MPFSDVPPQYDIRFAGGSKPPMFNFAKSFGEYLKQFMGQSLPSYEGQIDPGLSPTLMHLGSQLQARSMAPTPLGLSVAQGNLGRYMSPNFANPTARAQFGAPSYFGFNPNQATYGGTPMSSFSQLGMSGPTGQSGSSFLPFGGGQGTGPQQPSWMDFWNGPPIPGLSFQNPNYPLPGGQPFPIPGFPGVPAGPVGPQPGGGSMPTGPMLPDEKPVPGAPTTPKKRPGQMTRADWKALGITPGAPGSGFNDAQKKWLRENGFKGAAREKTFTDTQKNWLDTLSPEDQRKYGYRPGGGGGVKNAAPKPPTGPKKPPNFIPKSPRTGGD